MKLNEKCMKDILEYVVKNGDVTDNGVYCGCKITEMQEYFKSKYKLKETAYAVNKLIELEYITTNMSEKSWNSMHRIEDITYAGHKYLENN